MRVVLVGLGVIAVLYALTAARLERWSVGAPLVFVTAGVMLSTLTAGVLDAPHRSEPVKIATEATLALILFADASTIGARRLRGDATIPARLLLVGLPLTIALGSLLAHLVIPGVGWAMAGLIATILTPTDAALSVPVVTNRAVPERLRRALNVESGLNDGIATPIIVIMISVVAGTETAAASDVPGPLRAIGIALVVAVALGVTGGRLALWAQQHRSMTVTSERLIVIALAALSYLLAAQLGGNGFVAAFAAGLCFGTASRHVLHEATEFTETTAMFLSYAVWAVFGAVLLGPLLRQPWPWSSILYAVLALTVIRMIPVGLSLMGTRLGGVTTAFLGWFGPRGLASVVFLLMAADELHIEQLDHPLVQTVVWTIALSVLLHGLTAAPFVRSYVRATATTGSEPPERPLDVMESDGSQVKNPSTPTTP